MEGACGVSTKMSQQKSSFAATIDKIVADCNDRLLWVPYSKDKLTKQAARVLIEQWSSFTRHSRQCWAFVVGNCPIVEVRKFIVTENLYEELRKGTLILRFSPEWAWRWD